MPDIEPPSHQVGGLVFVPLSFTEPEIALALYERAQAIRAFGSRLTVRAGLIMVGAVAVLSFAIDVGTVSRPTYYSLQVNPLDQDIPEMLHTLSRQTRLLLLVFSPRRRERLLQNGNPLQPAFVQMLRMLDRLPAWSETDYSAALSEYLAAHPTAYSVWRSL